MSERKHYIDNIRWATVVLVIVYHVIYNFNSAGVIRNMNVQGIQQMDILLYFVYPWFMVLLFVVAGMSARYSLQNRTGKAFAKDRVKRLLVPSIAGIFMVGWINGWVTNQYTDMFAGNGDAIPWIIKCLIYCISGIGPLWFAHELFLASMVLLLLRKIDKKDNIWKLAGKANLLVVLLLGIVLWGSSRLFITPIIEVYRNGIYIFAFLLGYYLFSHEEITDLLVKFKIPLLVVAVAAGIGYTIYYYGENYTTRECLQNFFTNAYCYVMVLAIIGCFKAWFNKETKFSRYMTQRNFGFYVLHYPVLMVVAYSVLQMVNLPMICNYFVILVLELLLLPIVYEIVCRIPVIRFLLLGQSGRKKQ